MYTNQCSKCGEVFETKNPKRVICPDCLYPESAISQRPPGPPQQQPQQYQRPPQPNYGPRGGGYSGGGYPQQQGGGHQGGYGQQQRGGYPPQQQQGGYGRPQGGGYQQGGHQGGYGPRPSGPGRGPGGPGGYGRPPGGQGGYGPPRGGPGGYPQQQGGYGPPRQGGFGGPRPGGPPRGRGPGFGGPRPGGPPRGRGGPPKKLLVSREQLEEIEKLYRAALPLPNPDIHEVIGEKIDLSPSKVFFGINLVREKMRLPKLEYPKRKLAVTPEQLMAIETLYEPYLPLPPLGIHKIIAKQLKIDEWRVHVAIGLIRKNRNMDRWNEDRDDLPPDIKIISPEERKKAKKEAEKAAKQAATAAATAEEEAAPPEVAAPSAEAETPVEAPEPAEEKKPVKATRKKAVAKVADVSDDEEPAEVPKAVATRKKAE